MASVKEEGVSKQRGRKRLGLLLLEKARVSNGSRTTPKMTVAIRRQTPEEQRQWEMAFDVFLAELVHRDLGQQDK